MGTPHRSPDVGRRRSSPTGRGPAGRRRTPLPPRTHDRRLAPPAAGQPLLDRPAGAGRADNRLTRERNRTMTIALCTATTLDESRFLDPDELRWLLIRLAIDGPDAWRHDPEAAELIRFVIRRYADLARTHRQPAEDAAVAAFELLRTRTVLNTDDPWAVLTRGVEAALITEEVAEGLICSPRAAKELGAHRDPKAARVGMYETPIWEFHPRFRVPAPQDSIGVDPDADDRVNAFQAVDDVVRVFVFHNWPEHTARAGVEFICSRLIEFGDRDRAHESLRRERQPKALLDLDQGAWLTMLRVVLGSRNPNNRHTRAGR